MAKRFVRLLETAVGPSRVWIDMGYQLGERWLQPDVSVSWPDQEVKDDWVQALLCWLSKLPPETPLSVRSAVMIAN